MKHLGKDAKQFVDGIVEHLHKDTAGDTQLPKMKSLLRKVSQDALKDQVAKVMSAVTLTESEKEQLSEALSKKMGHQISLEYTVEPDIISGLRIEIADSIIDLSYEEELQTIGRMLLKGSHI